MRQRNRSSPAGLLLLSALLAWGCGDGGDDSDGGPGSLIWVKQAGGDFFDYGYDVDVCSDDSVIVTGKFEYTATFGHGEPNATDLTSSGGHDIYVARYDIAGSLVWAKRAGGSSGQDMGLGVAALSDDAVVVTGSFQGTATFGSGESNETSLTSAGNYDIYIARYNVNGSLLWASNRIARDLHSMYSRAVSIDA